MMANKSNRSAQGKSNFYVKTTDENQHHGLPIEDKPTQAEYKPKPQTDNSTKHDSIAAQEVRQTQENWYPTAHRPEEK